MIGALADVHGRVEDAVRGIGVRIFVAVLGMLFLIAGVANLYAVAFFLLAPRLDVIGAFGVLAGVSFTLAALLLLLRERKGRKREAARADAAQAMRLGLAFEAGRAASRGWPALLGVAAAALLLLKGRAGAPR